MMPTSSRVTDLKPGMRVSLKLSKDKQQVTEIREVQGNAGKNPSLASVYRALAEADTREAD